MFGSGGSADDPYDSLSWGITTWTFPFGPKVPASIRPRPKAFLLPHVFFVSLAAREDGKMDVMAYLLPEAFDKEET